MNERSRCSIVRGGRALAVHSKLARRQLKVVGTRPGEQRLEPAWKVEWVPVVHRDRDSPVCLRYKSAQSDTVGGGSDATFLARLYAFVLYRVRRSCRGWGALWSRATRSCSNFGGRDRVRGTRLARGGVDAERAFFGQCDSSRDSLVFNVGMNLALRATCSKFVRTTFGLCC